MAENKYLEKHSEISEEFNALPFEERIRIIRFKEATRLLLMEQIKDVLKKNHQRTLKELTDWENNILQGIEKMDNERGTQWLKNY